MSLKDSTVLPNLGTEFGHIQIALNSLHRGISKLEVNHQAIADDLDNNRGHWPGFMEISEKYRAEGEMQNSATMCGC